MPVPRCSALRGDGQPCGALAFSPDAVYCATTSGSRTFTAKTPSGPSRIPLSPHPARRETPIVLETESNGGTGT